MQYGSVAPVTSTRATIRISAISGTTSAITKDGQFMGRQQHPDF